MSSFTDMLVDNQDQALIDNILPALLLGGRIGKTGVNWFNGIKPYLGDIWAGRNLLFHKPFKKMTPEEFENYNNLGTDYYQYHLQKKPVNIKGYGQVTFGRHNRGKDKTQDMEQYPFLRKNLENSTWSRNTNYKNETDRNYDHFTNTYMGNEYDYLIENIINKGKKYKMMQKIDK